MGQEVNRAIGLAEALFGFRMSCGHLPGSINIMADAGSRAWSPPHDKIWSNLSFEWRPIPVPPSLRKIYKTFSNNFNRKHWPRDQDRSTHPRGNDGQSGPPPTVSTSGYPQMRNNIRYSLPYLLSTTGTQPRQRKENHYPRTPCCPPLAISRGIICENEVTRLASTQETSWLCAGCKECLHRQDKNNQSRAKSSKNFAHAATSKQPTIACSGGGAAVMGLFFLLRQSEYLADGRRIKPYIIRTSDVKFLNKEGLIKESLNSVLCSTSPGRTLTSNALVDAIKTTAASVGADPSQFGTLSMRSGGATALFAAGTDRLTIKLFGRWSADAFEIYTRMNDTVSESLSQRMTKGVMFRVSPATPEGLHPAQHS
ncbi:hypothetical protein GN958_ATG16145 [Phytophthora infestans]|uniref:Uncharacterized protein n=1 Tax=Phytophthora infestans TaxID=4787 RepID=A0A8S9U354_PHYIN|nr:hypothetical protein GN958_ATG16145 [Phytophthora infestans]